MILTLEQQVCSLESAKKLKEFGFRQDGLFYWFPFDHGIRKWQVTDHILGKERIKGWKNYARNNPDFDFYCAYTVAELGELLPGFITKDGRKYFQAFHKNTYHERNDGRVTYSHGFSYKAYWDQCYEDWLYGVCEEVEAEARAKMLIHIVERKLMEVKS